jgi:drug/metabolite transporter (DMT)-like permease
MMKHRLWVVVLALGTVALWGGSFPITKVALQGLGPMGIAFGRWAIASIALAAWLAFSGRLPVAATLVRCEWRAIIWVALAGITLFYALQNLALGYTTVTNAGILANLTSIFIAMLGAAWLHERVFSLDWAAMGIAFLGAALTSLGAGHLTLSSGGLVGDLLMVVATLFAALYSVGGKRLAARYPADVLITVVGAVGTLFLLPLALHEGFSLALPGYVWLSLLALGLGSGALANLWWLHILSFTSASRAGTVLFLIPITSTTVAVGILHEPLTWTMAAGAVLVLASVAVLQRQKRDLQPTATPVEQGTSTPDCPQAVRGYTTE